MKKSIIGSVPLGLEQFDKLPDAAHVRLPVVCALFGISRATAWRWTKQGRLPSPQKLGPGVTTWNVGALRRLGA
jgi:predicted DNA-binding transcriptional regulator AlpA